MRNAVKTVTVYRKEWDKEKGADVYHGTVLAGVSFFSRVSTVVSTEGLTAACEGVLRIPMAVCPVGLEIKNGDLVCEGALQTEELRPSDLNALCPHVFTVVGVTRNSSGREPHIKAVCK